VEERAVRGYATPPHVHGREDETLFIIEGEVAYTVDGSSGVATAGDAVFLPRGLPHHFRVVSDEAHFLLIITPGGFEEFFRQVSPPASAARLPGAEDHPHTDPADLVRYSAALGVTVFRPPTESEDPVIVAARTIVTSTDPDEIARCYRAIEDVIAGPVPTPPEMDTLVVLLLQAARRVQENPVHARALILLGIITEGGGPAAVQVNEAVPELARLVQPGSLRAVGLTFFYLLAHFPDHAELVRSAVEPLGLPEEDGQRLWRCLDTSDHLARIGRVWPSPTVWDLEPEERELDQTWRATIQLGESEALTLWESETTALLAYMGAKADYALGSIHA
jgi:hypothetical protein